MTRDELIEKIALALPGGCTHEKNVDAARLAVDIVLEEAAKIADRYGQKDGFMRELRAVEALQFPHIFIEARTGRSIAKHLRALKAIEDDISPG